MGVTRSDCTERLRTFVCAQLGAGGKAIASMGKCSCGFGLYSTLSRIFCGALYRHERLMAAFTIEARRSKRSNCVGIPQGDKLYRGDPKADSVPLRIHARYTGQKTCTLNVLSGYMYTMHGDFPKSLLPMATTCVRTLLPDRYQR